MIDLESEFRFDTTQVRRYAHHMQNGGQIRQYDIDYCAKACEEKDIMIEELRAEVRRLRKIDIEHSWTQYPDRMGK